jgi:hypothetical protein
MGRLTLKDHLQALGCPLDADEFRDRLAEKEAAAGAIARGDDPHSVAERLAIRTESRNDSLHLP